MSANVPTPKTDETCFHAVPSRDTHMPSVCDAEFARELERELAAAKAEAEELRKELADRPSIGMVQILKQTIKAEHDEAEALREKLHNISNEFPAVYQRGIRDGIREGLLRAAEICDDHDNADDQGYGAWKAAAAIRAEAEKEGK